MLVKKERRKLKTIKERPLIMRANLRRAPVQRARALCGVRDVHSRILLRFQVGVDFRRKVWRGTIRTRTSWQIVLSSSSIFFRYSSAMLCFAASLFCSIEEMTRHDDRRAPTTFLYATERRFRS